MLLIWLESKNFSNYKKGDKDFQCYNYFSRWHLGNCKLDYLPNQRGFDSFLGYWSGGEVKKKLKYKFKYICTY